MQINEKHDDDNIMSLIQCYVFYHMELYESFNYFVK